MENNYEVATNTPFDEAQKQALATLGGLADDGSRFVTDLSSQQQAFCSAKLSDDDVIGKATLFNAVSAPEKRIKDCINMDIMIKDIYCEPVKLLQEDGTEEYCPRVVLIDIDGIGYQSVSKGIWGAVKNLINTVGAPTYPIGIPVKIMQVTKGTNAILTFKLNLEKMIQMKKEAEKAEKSNKK